MRLCGGLRGPADGTTTTRPPQYTTQTGKRELGLIRLRLTLGAPVNARVLGSESLEFF